jgi:hypothetical protein
VCPCVSHAILMLMQECVFYENGQEDPDRVCSHINVNWRPSVLQCSPAFCRLLEPPCTFSFTPFTARRIVCKGIFGGGARRCSTRCMFALIFSAAVLVDAPPATCLFQTHLWWLCLQMLEPLYCLHPLFMWLCSQMLDPPHCLVGCDTASRLFSTPYFSAA